MRTTSTIRTIKKQTNLGILFIYLFTGEVCVKVIFNFLSKLFGPLVFSLSTCSISVGFRPTVLGSIVSAS